MVQLWIWLAGAGLGGYGGSWVKGRQGVSAGVENRTRGESLLCSVEKDRAEMRLGIDD